MDLTKTINNSNLIVSLVWEKTKSEYMGSNNFVVTLILFTILGGGFGVFAFFVIRMIVAPQKVNTLANMVKQGKTTPAIRMAKQMLAKEPRNPELHYLLAQSYQKEGKDELALMEYKTVNNISNFHGVCKENIFRKEIAQLYTRFGQKEEALKEYLVLIKIEPYEANHYYQAGVLFESRGKKGQALGYYKKALENDPRHSDSYFRLGTLLYNTKKAGDARIYLEKALKLNAENFKVNFYLGKIFKEGKNYPLALEFFEKAQKDPDFKIKSLIERGICGVSMKDFDGAIADFERAIKLNEQNDKPKDRETLYARYFLAHCYEKIRDLDKAMDHWEYIYTIDKSFRDVAEKLSQFQELRSDDVMKDYMTASNAEFEKICSGITSILNHSVTDVRTTSDSCVIIAVEKSSGQWRNTRKFPKLFQFVRTGEFIDLPVIRKFHEEISKYKVVRGLFFSSSQFSRSAIEFVESRPIELYDKEKFQDLLHKYNDLEK